MTEELDSRFAEDINKQMRVPDRIFVQGEQNRSPTFMGINGPPSSTISFGGGRGRGGGDNVPEMSVPDRILVAGGDRHIAAKSTPFEMQVENSVIPPSRHDVIIEMLHKSVSVLLIILFEFQVRVTTPPRSIRLDDHNFPSSTTNRSEDEQSLNGNDEDHDELPNQKSTLQSNMERSSRSSSFLTTPKRGLGKIGGVPRSASVESESLVYGSRHASDPSMAMLETIQGGGGHGTNPWEEIQLVRRQIAKLNHRLMAVELENQQQQQREMILTVLVSAYFVGKFFMWLNKTP